MDRGTERPTCPEEGRPESLSKNSWEEKNTRLHYSLERRGMRLLMGAWDASC